MPRNPGTKKNAHNHKHDTGLVGPGKRITKEKSNGHLHAGPKATLPDEPVPTSGVPSVPMTSSFNNISTSDLSESTQATGQEPRRLGLKQRDSDDSYDVQHDGHGQDPQGTSQLPRRYTQPTTSRPRASHEVNHLHMASSILKSSPACDTVAILIFLLALPSMVLTIIQALFASLTLMPPTGVSPGSLLSLLDVFQGSAGPPSLATMVIVDGLCLGLWFCLWNWARSFALDLAQIHIALTLGSGSAGKNSRVDTVCLALVLLLHSIRSKGVRQFLYHRVIPAKVMTHGSLAQFLQLLPSEADFGEYNDHPHWVRSLFAIHIISQALMAFVRRRVTSTQAASSAKLSKRAETEDLPGGMAQDASNVDGRPIAASSTALDLSATSIGAREAKDKGFNAKKKRRQANQARSRQPFWAAVASTKVHVLREYEHKKRLSKTAHGPEGTSDGAVNEEMVWITHVEPASISFEAINIPPPDADQESMLPTNCRPFFVRINGARWHSVYLEPAEPSESQEYMTQWSGEINGLAPNCTYTCTFVRVEDDEEFTSVAVKTPALSDKDAAASQVSASVRPSLRPSSPTSTLKNSIAAAEIKLNEARNRLLKTRRAHKASLSKIEKEVEFFNYRLKSSGDDAKQRQKLLQAEQSIRRTEDATVSITAALDDLEAIPEEESDEYTFKKAAFEKRSELLSAANESLTAAKTSAKNDLTCVKNELSSLAARKERLTSRQMRLAEQHDRITHANAQGLNEKERKAAESVAKQLEQQKIEADYMQYFNAFNNEIRQLQAQTNQAWLEIQTHERQAQSQRESLIRHEGPHTPEGILPGTNPHPPFSIANRPFNYGFPFTHFPPAPHSPDGPQPSPFLPLAKASAHGGGGSNRPRSGTNRSFGAGSNYSLEFEEADPIPPLPSHSEFGDSARKASDGSPGKPNGSPGVIGGGSGLMGTPTRGNHSPGSGTAFGTGHVSTW